MSYNLMTGQSSDSILVSGALFLIHLALQNSPVCLGYAIPNQFQTYDKQPQTGSGFQSVVTQFHNIFQGPGPGPAFSQQWKSPENQNSQNYVHHHNNGPSFSFSSSTSSHSSSSDLGRLDEPLSFTFPILTKGRNIPIFERVVVTNRVDPDFTYANYVSDPKSSAVISQPQSSQAPPRSHYFAPFYHPQNQFATPQGSYSPGMISPFQPQPQYWGQHNWGQNHWGQYPQGFGPNPTFAKMMMTPTTPMGGGILMPNPKYNSPPSGPSSGLLPLPSFRSIRQAPPGSFFISVRNRDGFLTYAPEPIFPRPPDPMWSTDPKQTVGAIPAWTMTEMFPRVSKPSQNQRSSGVAWRGGSGQNALPGPAKPHKSNKNDHVKGPGSSGMTYPFHDPRYPYYPHPMGYVNASSMMGNVIGNEVTPMGHHARQIPWGMRTNIMMPPPPPPPPTPVRSRSNSSSTSTSSPAVRQSSNYNPMHIDPSHSFMDNFISSGNNATQKAPIFSQARRSKRQQSQPQPRPPLGFPGNGWMQSNQMPPLPQGQGQVTGQSQGLFPYPQPPFLQPQNPPKSNRAGPQAYPFNEQNGQFQSRSSGQPQFLQPQGLQGQRPGQGQQSYFHQTSSSWNSGNGGGLRPPPSPSPFGSGGGVPGVRGWGNSDPSNPIGSHNPTIAGPSRAGEQGFGPRSDPRIGGGFGNFGNFPIPPIPGGPYSRPYEIGQQQQHQQHSGQYQIWKTNFTNPYEQKEPINHTKEPKTPILPHGGGEVSIYSKSKSNSSVHRVHGGMSGNNATKENYKFTSDSTILQRHLQQAKQVLREQKSREQEAANRNTSTTTTTKFRYPLPQQQQQQFQHGSTSQQSSTTKGHGVGVGVDVGVTTLPDAISISTLLRNTKSGSIPSSTPGPAGTFGVIGRPFNESIYPPTRISAPSGPTPTDANSGFQLPQFQQQQWPQQQQQWVQRPNHDVFATDVSKHGRFSRHLEGIEEFASAEDLLAMDIQPLDEDEPMDEGVLN